MQSYAHCLGALIVHLTVSESNREIVVCPPIPNHSLTFIPSGNPSEVSISHLIGNSAELLIGIEVRIIGGV